MSEVSAPDSYLNDFSIKCIRGELIVFAGLSAGKADARRAVAACNFAHIRRKSSNSPTRSDITRSGSLITATAIALRSGVTAFPEKNRMCLCYSLLLNGRRQMSTSGKPYLVTPPPAAGRKLQRALKVRADHVCATECISRSSHPVGFLVRGLVCAIGGDFSDRRVSLWRIQRFDRMFN